MRGGKQFERQTTRTNITQTLRRTEKLTTARYWTFSSPSRLDSLLTLCIGQNTHFSQSEADDFGSMC